MSARQYPRQAWVLLPSFKPKEVTIIEKAHPYSSMFSDWDKAEGGKTYHVDKLHPSITAAIADGREQVKKMAADIAKRQASMEKRIASLDKAEKGGAA